LWTLNSELSCSFWHGLAEDARGPEDQDEDEDSKHHHLGPFGVDKEVAECLDYPDEQAAQGGAADVADAAEDGAGEGEEAAAEALQEPGVAVVDAEDEAGGAGERPTDHERERDGRVDVDTHQRRRLL